MYIVANCLMGSAPYLLNAIKADTLEDAVNLAVRMSLEQLGEDDDDGEEEVRAKVEADDSYYDPNGEWSVCIAKLEE